MERKSDKFEEIKIRPRSERFQILDGNAIQFISEEECQKKIASGILFDVTAPEKEV